MATILIENLGKAISVSDTTRPLLYLLQDEFIDWMHACGGKGRCTTCKAIILEGHENLGVRTRDEERYAENGDLQPNERLACQVSVLGDIRIVVPEESKLPHLKYTD
jgi:ferredoxin, 2Fe-2S